MPGSILLAVDEHSVRASRARGLSAARYDVRVCGPQLAQITASLVSARPHVTVLDTRGAKGELLATCRGLRAVAPETRLLVLSAYTSAHERIAGLDAGADEWLPESCGLPEILAYLRAAFRRIPLTAAPALLDLWGASDTYLDLGDLRLQPASRRAWRGAVEITLSQTEYDLLEFLVRHPDTVLSRATIHEQVWGYDFGRDSKNLSVYISYLRRKIGSRDQTPLIHTVRGYGYLVRSPAR